MRVYVDVDPDDVLDELTNEELMQEVNRRKLVTYVDLTEEVQKLYDAIYINNDVGANAALSELFDVAIGRVFVDKIQIV